MIYHIFANKSNIGDWLSAKGIQSTLRGEPITELFCDVPFVEETIARLQQAQPNDLVIIGGGGLFMDYFAPFWEAFLEIADNLSYGIWGVGYCDLTQEHSLPPRDLIETIVRRSRFCHVRDELTRGHLSQLNLAPPSGCPSLLCLAPTNVQGRGVLHVDNYTTVGEQAFAYMDELGRSYAAATGRQYRRTNNRIQSGTEACLDECLALYQEADVILSSALHGCIIGAGLQKKVVAVSGDRKIDAFMQLVGLGDWVCGREEVGKVDSLLDEVESQQSCAQTIAALRAVQTEIGEKVRTAHAAKHASECKCG